MEININKLDYGVLIFSSSGDIISLNDWIKERFIQNMIHTNGLFLNTISYDLSKIILTLLQSANTPVHEDFSIELETLHYGVKTYKVYITEYGDKTYMLSMFDTPASDPVLKSLYMKNRLDIYRNITDMISIEYNNHLTAILGFAAFAKNSLNPESELYKYFNIIENSAVNAASLTNQLLTFTGIDYYRQKVININKTIIQNIEIFRRVFPSSISIHTDLYPGDLLIYWDENQINQILINAIMNAREAIELKQTAGLLSVTTKISHGNIIIEITDDGIGIPEDNLSRVFKKNFTTKDVRYHSGLGLSVADGIIKNIGGAIEINSVENSGTTIRYKIPDSTVKINQIEDQKNISTESEITSNKTVLIIDDKASIRNLATILLKAKGYNSLTASDSTEAMKLLLNSKIDLILLDMMMPDIRGDELYFRIQEKYAHIPVVILTGTTNEQLVQNLIQKYKLGLILKPFKNEEFYDIIEKRINNRISDDSL